MITLVNLSDAYSFGSAGIYTVTLEIDLQFSEDIPTDIETLNTTSIEQVFSNSEELSLTEGQSGPKLTLGELARLNQANVTDPKKCGPKTPKIAGKPKCTRKQKMCMLQAYVLAFQAIEKSIESIAENPALYKEWFGEPVDDKVKKNYEKC